MTLYNKRKDKLITDLKNKEYREAFVASHVSNGIALQIRTMRGKLTQGEFGKLTNMKQEQLSRLENPDNEMLTVKTLLKLAAARDVALMVRFVPFGDLAKWDLNLSSNSLEVSSFKQDPYFQEIGKNSIVAIARKEYSELLTQEVSGNLIRINFKNRENLSSQQKINPPLTGSASSIAISI